MFHEIDPQLMKPPDGSQKKRWLRDSEDGCDLFIWEDEEGNVKCFQFWFHDALVDWDRDRGLRTGSIDDKSGAFVNIQSDLYQIHQNVNKEILEVVKDLLNKKSINNKVLTSIKDTLYQISEQI
jgi:hypothetical protein